MKIKDILGEEAVAVIKDYKPGQSLSFTDQAGGTMTTVDLKKNPMAVKPDEQGNLTYDPTPDSTAAIPGQEKAPEIKPGAQIQIDTSTTEGFNSDAEEELHDIANSGDHDRLYSAMTGERGPEVQGILMDMVDEISSETNLHADDDIEKIQDIIMGKLIDQYAEKDDNPEEQEAEGYAPGTVLDVKNERMDESSYITALAKRISNTEAKVSTKNSDVLDIKKLAGL